MKTKLFTKLLFLFTLIVLVFVRCQREENDAVVSIDQNNDNEIASHAFLQKDEPFSSVMKKLTRDDLSPQELVKLYFFEYPRSYTNEQTDIICKMFEEKIRSMSAYEYELFEYAKIDYKPKGEKYQKYLELSFYQDDEDSKEFTKKVLDLAISKYSVSLNKLSDEKQIELWKEVEEIAKKKVNKDIKCQVVFYGSIACVSNYIRPYLYGKGWDSYSQKALYSEPSYCHWEYLFKGRQKYKYIKAGNTPTKLLFKSARGCAKTKAYAYGTVMILHKSRVNKYLGKNKPYNALIYVYTRTR